MSESVHPEPYTIEQLEDEPFATTVQDLQGVMWVATNAKSYHGLRFWHSNAEPPISLDSTGLLGKLPHCPTVGPNESVPAAWATCPPQAGTVISDGSRLYMTDEERNWNGIPNFDSAVVIADPRWGEAWTAQQSSNETSPLESITSPDDLSSMP